MGSFVGAALGWTSPNKLPIIGRLVWAAPTFDEGSAQKSLYWFEALR